MSEYEEAEEGAAGSLHPIASALFSEEQHHESSLFAGEEQPPTTSPIASTAAGLEEIDVDCSAEPLPPDAELENISESYGREAEKVRYEARTRRYGLELSSDEPENYAAAGAIEDSSTHQMKEQYSNESSNRFAAPNEVTTLSPPSPFTLADFDTESAFDPRIHNKIQMSGDDTAGSQPALETLRGQDSTQAQGSNDENHLVGDDEESPNNLAEHVGAYDVSHTLDQEPNENGGNVISVLEHEQNESLPIIPEAFLVQEQPTGSNDIIIAATATPLLPWWKRKKTVFSLLCFVGIVAAIAAGVSSSLVKRERDANNNNAVLLEEDESVPSSAPSASSAPTPEHSASPSTSLVPSSAPSACSNKISTNAQKLDIPLENTYDTQAKLHGENAVVVTREGGTGNVHIIFYLLKGGNWERGNHFIENDGLYSYGYDGDYISQIQSKISLALSGRFAFVSFPNRYHGNSQGVVLIYEQNSLDVWESKDEPLVPQDDNYTGYVSEFGFSVDLDGDLACVVSNGIPGGGTQPRVYVYQYQHKYPDCTWCSEEVWVQVHRLDLPFPPTAKECFIAGETLAIQINDYRIDLYRYDKDSDTYTRIQDPFLDESMVSVSFDHDHLIYLTGAHKRDCFQPNEFFVYNPIGANLRYALQQQVAYSNHTRCALLPQEQPDPDHLITLTAYERSISHDRDTLVVPNSVVNQTNVYIRDDGYWVLALVLDQPYRGYHVSGRNLLAIGDDTIAQNEDVYYFEVEICELAPTQMPSVSLPPSMSLVPTIGTTFGATPIAGATSLSPTKSPSFRIPSSLPSISQLPSATAAPSMLPSLTSLPTDTCYWIKIYIKYDHSPTESSFELVRINQVGDNTMIKSYKEENDDAELYTNSMCLAPGTYQFTMQDNDLDGLGKGHYNVSSYGDLIVEGGDFGLFESTQFYLPWTVAPTSMPSQSQKPSMSISPSIRPSSFPSDEPSLSIAPSSHPSLSMAPTFSSFPTETCYWVNITIVYDNYPLEVSWYLDNLRGAVSVDEYQEENPDSSSYTKSFCLTEGEYYFSIYDSAGDGICCEYGAGYYSITAQGGELIARGGEFRWHDSVEFLLPWTPSPTTTPSLSQNPTSTASPSFRPSLSISPTSSHQPSPKATPALTRGTPFPTEPFPTGTPRTHVPITPFPTETEATRPPSPPSILVTLLCPPATIVGCTAPNPSNPEDECQHVGTPCINGTDDEICCRDACPRNYCASRSWWPSSTSSP